MLHSEYVDYFRDIAVHHKLIAHSEQNKRFYRMNIEEVLSALKTKLEYVNKAALVIQSYEKSIDDFYSDNLRDVKNGLFMVVKKVNDRDFNHEETISAETELITYSILSKM